MNPVLSFGGYLKGKFETRVPYGSFFFIISYYLKRVRYHNSSLETIPTAIPIAVDQSSSAGSGHSTSSRWSLVHYTWVFLDATESFLLTLHLFLQIKKSDTERYGQVEQRRLKVIDQFPLRPQDRDFANAISRAFTLLNVDFMTGFLHPLQFLVDLVFLFNIILFYYFERTIPGIATKFAGSSCNDLVTIDGVQILY